MQIRLIEPTENLESKKPLKQRCFVGGGDCDDQKDSDFALEERIRLAIFVEHCGDEWVAAVNSGIGDEWL